MLLASGIRVAKADIEIQMVMIKRPISVLFCFKVF
jgi:hypothetical protein